MGLALRMNIHGRGYYKGKDPEERMNSKNSVLASVLSAKIQWIRMSRLGCLWVNGGERWKSWKSNLTTILVEEGGREGGVKAPWNTTEPKGGVAGQYPAWHSIRGAPGLWPCRPVIGWERPWEAELSGPGQLHSLVTDQRALPLKSCEQGPVQRWGQKGVHRPDHRFFHLRAERGIKGVFSLGYTELDASRGH